jgi:hypothetical protein
LYGAETMNELVKQMDKQILINAKLKTENSGQKIEMTRRSSLRRRRRALDF